MDPKKFLVVNKNILYFNGCYVYNKGIFGAFRTQSQLAQAYVNWLFL